MSLAMLGVLGVLLSAVDPPVMAAKFGGKVRLENLNPPASYTISGEGNGGAMGFAKGGADVALEELGPSETLLTYSVKVLLDNAALVKLNTSIILLTSSSSTCAKPERERHVAGPNGNLSAAS